MNHWIHDNLQHPNTHTYTITLILFSQSVSDWLDRVWQRRHSSFTLFPMTVLTVLDTSGGSRASSSSSVSPLEQWVSKPRVAVRLVARPAERFSLRKNDRASGLCERVSVCRVWKERLEGERACPVAPCQLRNGVLTVVTCSVSAIVCRSERGVQSGRDDGLHDGRTSGQHDAPASRWSHLPQPIPLSSWVLRPPLIKVSLNAVTVRYRDRTIFFRTTGVLFAIHCPRWRHRVSQSSTLISTGQRWIVELNDHVIRERLAVETLVETDCRSFTFSRPFDLGEPLRLAKVYWN